MNKKYLVNAKHKNHCSALLRLFQSPELYFGLYLPQYMLVPEI